MLFSRCTDLCNVGFLQDMLLAKQGKIYNDANGDIHFYRLSGNHSSMAFIDLLKDSGRAMEKLGPDLVAKLTDSSTSTLVPKRTVSIYTYRQALDFLQKKSLIPLNCSNGPDTKALVEEFFTICATMDNNKNEIHSKYNAHTAAG